MEVNKSVEATPSSSAVHHEIIAEPEEQARVSMNVPAQEAMQKRSQVESSMKPSTAEQESEETEFTLDEPEIPMRPSIV